MNDMINDSILEVSQQMQQTIMIEHGAGLKRLKSIELKLYERFGANNIELIKIINGTMKFNLNSSLKISTVL